MPKITQIVPKPEKERVWIFVDGQYCCSVRARTFPAMNLAIGQEITCERIKEIENFHFKLQYGSKAWEAEKVRLKVARSLIEKIDSRLKVEVSGFGADSTDLIATHPKESGAPDIEIKSTVKNITICYVEVTGTEYMRGSDLRPDARRN